MTSYFIRRFLLIVPTFIGVTILVFTLTRLVPGGPIERMLSEAAQAGMSETSAVSSYDGHGGSMLSDDQLEDLKAYYGFDKPVVVAYFEWLGKVLVLDLGKSTRYSDPVWDTIRDRLPSRSSIGVCTLIITYGVCIPLGMFKAHTPQVRLRQHDVGRRLAGYAIPSYVVAIFLLTVFAANLEWFPLGGFVSDDFDDFSTMEQIADLFDHAALPLIAYVAGAFAFTTMLMKNSLMDNLAAEYVRTAVAKGMDFRRAIFGHALRNSLIPIATSFGNNLSIIITGSFLIEKIFNIDGVRAAWLRIPGRARLSGGNGNTGALRPVVPHREHSLRHLRRLVDPRVKFGSGDANQ